MTSEEERAQARTSNRRTLIGFAVVVGLFAAPALYRIGRYLIDLL